MSRPRRGSARPASRRSDPVSTAELTITAIGHRGDGVAVWQGAPVYVPGTTTGDRVQVRLDAAGGDHRRGRVEALLAPGPDRVEPHCPYFGQCGGCTLQHVSTVAYVEWKRMQVCSLLVRAGMGYTGDIPLIPVPAGTRRRASLGVQLAGIRLVVGFAGRFSHRLIDVQACPVLVPALAAIPGLLRRSLPAGLVPAGGLAVHATEGEEGVDLLLSGLPAPDLSAREALAALAEAGDLARLSWQSGPAMTPEPLAARRPVWVRFGSVPVAVPAGAFLQASRASEAALVGAVLRAVGPAGRVADLFAGCGTFTFPLAAVPARVHAVDGDAAALAALGRAARGWPGVTCERRDLFANPLDPAELAGFAAVVFDPPRAGAAAQVQALAASGVPVVVAVSCNPTTFIRDARALGQGGYRLESLTLVDQFLWSAHIELVARFSRAASPPA